MLRGGAIFAASYCYWSVPFDEATLSRLLDGIKQRNTEEPWAGLHKRPPDGLRLTDLSPFGTLT